MDLDLILILIIIGLQAYIFNETRKEIGKFHHFFPNIKDVQIAKTKLSKDNTVYSAGDEITNENANVEVIEFKGKKTRYPLFNKTTKSTNHYLSQNFGSAADFNIIKDICERQIEQQENAINSRINVPLYLGLGGTFLGIIFGVDGVNFTDMTGDLNQESVDKLLDNVVLAMIASFVGLILTVYSSAILLKKAVYKNESDKNEYYDLIQRDLLPVLNTGIAGSLNSFRDVLNHFIHRFSGNIEDYAKSAETLNNNLAIQHKVLEEINKLSLTRTAKKISEVFMSLNESSEHLDSFKDYQKTLNQTLEKFNITIDETNKIKDDFKGFNSSLNTMGTALSANLELQTQFKNSLETHFPTVKPAQEIWRKHVDELNEDIKGVYGELNNYFKESSQQIQEFVSNNENFFAGMNDIQNSIKIFVNNSNLQTEQYKNLKKEMGEIKTELRENNKSSNKLNKKLLDTIIKLETKMDMD